MQSQWTTIQGQLAQMESSGKQTDKIIEHARASVESAQTSADAAKKSADALINAERAWVMVDVDWAPHGGHTMFGRSNGVDTVIAPFRFKCSNSGKTPAWITEKWACFKIVDFPISLPARPDMESMKLIRNEPEPLTVGGSTHYDNACTCEGVRGVDRVAIIYGFVKYRDVFSPDRETFFGYRLTYGDQLVRLEGYPKYNENA